MTRLYRLPLPSGGVVRVRKLTPTVLLSQNLVSLPLLSAAVVVTEHDEAPKRSNAIKTLAAFARAAILDEDFDPADLSPTDLMAVYQWATTPGVEAPAVVEGERPWRTSDFLPMIRGEAAMAVDMVSRRYGQRPSDVLGITDPIIAVDLDLAVAFRGLRTEARGDSGDVEVEDVWGNTYKVPAHWTRTDPNARVVHADALAARVVRSGARELALSAGGALGAGPGDAFGPMNRFRRGSE